jgi:ribosome-binding factor A
VQLRHTPGLSFQADHSFDEAARINALLHHPRVAQDVEAEAAENNDGELPEPDDDGR